MSAPIAPENERGLCLSLSPKTLSDSVSLSQDKHLERPYLRLHQTLPVDISPETPCDTTTPLHYDSYEYTRSREHFTPQGAGNKSRRDSNGQAVARIAFSRHPVRRFYPVSRL